MPIMPPEDAPDHAGRAAEHVLALVAATDPTYRVTPERHDEMVALVRSVARVLLVGRAQ